MAPGNDRPARTPDAPSRRLSTFLLFLQARPWARFCLAFCLAVVVIAARRWQQFADPDVWVEDGTKLIPDFLEHGWAGVLRPVNGYLIVPAKLVSCAALSLSFAQYALVGTLLATVAQALCVAVVASAPTTLPSPLACALAILCVPTMPETFALTLYTFWWTTLLLPVALLWSTTASVWPRYLCLLLGAFSSPYVVALTPAFLVRAVVERRRRETLFCGLAVLLAASQAVLVRLLIHGNAGSPVASLKLAGLVVGKFFGTTIYALTTFGSTDASVAAAAIFGSIVVAILLFGLLLVPRIDRLGYALLGLALAAAIVSSVSRVPVWELHPVWSGPRYFFLPAILTGWMLIWIATKGAVPLNTIALLPLGAVLAAFIFVFALSFQVPKAAWPKQVDRCRVSDGDYAFDVQFGDPTTHWELRLTGSDCRRLAAAALFD